MIPETICLIQKVYYKQTLYLIYLSAAPGGFPQPTEEEFRERVDRLRVRAFDGLYGFYLFLQKIGKM